MKNISKNLNLKLNRLAKLLIIISSVCILLAFINLSNKKHSILGIAPTESNITVTIGKAKDKPKIVTYIDPLCPRCKEFHDDTLKKVKSEYVDSNKLQLEVRLLSIIAKESAPLVQFAMCSNDQNAFWDSLSLLYDQLYRNNSKSPKENATNFFEDYSYNKLANYLKINPAKLESCIADNTYLNKIEESNFKAYNSGVISTPTTFISGTDPIRGYLTYDQIKPLLNQVK